MRWRLFLTVLAVLLTGAGLLSAPASSAPPTYQHLRPGGQPQLRERVPVNVVFVGYDAAPRARARFAAGLPRGYEPVVRSRLFYGQTEPLGIRYTYDYRVRFADRAYEDRLFARLARLARRAPLTDYQRLYNRQQSNAITIRSNREIDAPSVERWLANNPPPGVDTRRNTVYFVNWWGRSDFRHHVYTKTDEPDPDTGFNFGVERDSRAIIAWGGTTAQDEENGLGSTRRVWFHDLSAGPEAWTANWNVDDRDLDGNGVEDYRMPPTWEYRPGGYRHPRALMPDLARITRYVALNLLFTSSPLYPVELPTSEPPTSVNLDNNTYEGWPGVNASARFIRPALLLSELRELRWRNRLDYDNQDLPFRGEARRCYRLVFDNRSCYPQLGYPPFANFFLQNTFQLARTRDDQGRVDYEMPIFSYAVGPGVPVPALGFADDNYRDGTQSYVFAFVSPEVVQAGYGLTTTLIHEVGHHVGMSHPHDGYDSSSGVDYAPADRFFFAWSGDQSNTMMSYIDLNWDFSQFDRDNSDRFVTAAYVEAANRLAAEVLADDDPRAARDDLLAADRLVGQAERAFAAHRYPAALRLAERAYRRVVTGAEEVGVSVAVITARMSADLAAAKASVPAHEGGDFIDTLEDGPRGLP